MVERYACQTTQLLEATEPLSPRDLRQYVFDVTTGNHSARRVLRVCVLAQLRWLLARIPGASRLLGGFSDWMHTLLSGRGVPSMRGQVPAGERAPSERLGLQPGELVRVKSQAEIELTVGANGMNRGLWFDHEEMAPYCGRVARVQRSVTKIIDETSGKMLTMKEPCIILEGVVCKSEYATCRLNCPRAIPSYWREIWLERVDGDHSPDVA